MSKIFLVTLSCILLMKNIESSEDIVVNTNVGEIHGLLADDGDYAMFLGIPYATVDSAKPFENSKPYLKFDTPFAAYDDSIVCPQIDEFTFEPVGSVNCLNLNIYVPKTVNGDPFAVLVLFYGGGFAIGSAGRFLLYGPKYLVRQDVILVTFNYRVGPYGFMCLDIPEVPGNQGLKDQQLAMKWIKNNIHSFGGDPERITLFGESAGGVSINFHLMSAEEALFRSIILQSGTILNAEVIRDSHPTAPMRISEILGYKTSDVHKALAFLATVRSNLVIEAASKINVVFRPCIEKSFENVTNFLADHPINVDIPKINGMPVMLGYTSQEMLPIHYASTPEHLVNSNIIGNRLKASFDFDGETYSQMEKILTQFYINDKEIITEDSKWGVIDFESDIMYMYPGHRSVGHFLRKGAAKVYYYVFSYDGGRNFVKHRGNITVGGAAHADERGYLFDISYMDTPSAEDQLVLDQMTAMWANFAKFGDPTPNISELLPVKWEPVTEGSPYHYMDIDGSLNVGKRPFHKRMAFMDLFILANKEKQKGYRKL